jgi:hypothetical protein
MVTSINMFQNQVVILTALAAFGTTFVGAPIFTVNPTWTTSNTTLLYLTPSADGLNCAVESRGPTGTATVTVSAQGATPLTASVTIIVNPIANNLATGIAITAEGPPFNPPQPGPPNPPM